MHLSTIDYLLWYGSPVLQAIIAVCMFRRGLHREYRLFFNYTLFAVISDPVLLAFHASSYAAYYYAYLVNTGLSILLSFAVLQEIFENAFRPYPALRDLGIVLFRWSVLVVLLVAVMWALGTSHASRNGTLADIFFLVDRCLRLAQCSLVFFLLLLSEYLGIPHHSFLFGIALGFGFFAAVNMLVASVVQHSFWHRTALRHINSGAYLLASLIWLGYTAAACSKRAVLQGGVVRSPDWNSALQDVRSPVPETSVLDTIDRTVEQLLYPTRAESRVKVAARAS